MKLLFIVLVSGLFFGCGNSSSEQAAFSSELGISSYRQKQVIYEDNGTIVDVKYDESSRPLFLDTMVWLDDNSYTRGDSDEYETLVRLDNFGVEIDSTDTFKNGEVRGSHRIDPTYENGRLTKTIEIVRSPFDSFEVTRRFTYSEDGLLTGSAKFNGALSSEELMTADDSEAPLGRVFTYDSLGRMISLELYVYNDEDVRVRAHKADFEYIPDELKIIATRYTFNNESLGRTIYLYEEGPCKDLRRALEASANGPVTCGDIF